MGKDEDCPFGGSLVVSGADLEERMEMDGLEMIVNGEKSNEELKFQGGIFVEPRRDIRLGQRVED